MPLTRLAIANFRNISQAELVFSPEINLIIGPNGSGKTSLLEAIYYLGRARSFRTRHSRLLIQHEQPAFTLIGQIAEKSGSPRTIGIERRPRGQTLRLAGQEVRRLAELVRIMPIQLLNPDSHLLLEGGPRYRRRFLDWGVFHVEPRFHSIWQQYTKSLKQRNAALRQGQSRRDVETWNPSLAEAGMQLDRFRREYLAALLPYVQGNLRALVALPALEFHYQPGWSEETSFEDDLQAGLDGDLKRGFTRHGPHRADVQPIMEGLPAVERISRGQQKQLVTALLLAQAQLMMDINQQRCVFLIDDLPSELDESHRRRVLSRLQELQAQIFITATEEAAIPAAAGDKGKWFHVEHGGVQEVI